MGRSIPSVLALSGALPPQPKNVKNGGWALLLLSAIIVASGQIRVVITQRGPSISSAWHTSDNRSSGCPKLLAQWLRFRSLLSSQLVQKKSKSQSTSPSQFQRLRSTPANTSDLTLDHGPRAGAGLPGARGFLKNRTGAQPSLLATVAGGSLC